MKDPVLHIELRRWADIMVIAPLDANTLAKISNGICDNLLVSFTIGNHTLLKKFIMIKIDCKFCKYGLLI